MSTCPCPCPWRRRALAVCRACRSPSPGSEVTIMYYNSGFIILFCGKNKYYSFLGIFSVHLFHLLPYPQKKQKEKPNWQLPGVRHYILPNANPTCWVGQRDNLLVLEPSRPGDGSLSHRCSTVLMRACPPHFFPLTLFALTSFLALVFFGHLNLDSIDFLCLRGRQRRKSFSSTYSIHCGCLRN